MAGSTSRTLSGDVPSCRSGYIGMRSLRFSVVAACVLFTTPLEAQSFITGVRAGVNYARQVGIHGASSHLPGVTAGFTVATEITTWLGVQGEMLYSQKGWRAGQIWESLHYVEFPVLARLAIPLTDVDSNPDPGLQPFVLAGVAGAALLDCNDVWGGDQPNTPDGGLGVPRPASIQFLANCNRYGGASRDRSWVYGAGVTVRRLRQHFTLEVRHTR